MKQLTLCLCAFSIAFSYAGIIPESLEVVDGEGFLLRLDPIVEMSFETCQLTRNRKGYSFQPGVNHSYVAAGGETIMSFEYNDNRECGVRVLNVNPSSRGQWTLTGTNKEMDLVATGTATITVNNNNGYNEQSGKLWNRRKVDDEPLNRQQGPIAQILEKPSGNKVFHCASSIEVRSCSIEHLASGQIFHIEQGLQDPEYSAYKTDFARGICQFEITAPSNENQWGIWEMRLNGNREKCVFQFYEGRALESLKERQKTTIQIKTMEDSYRVPCVKKAPYPLTECFLITDNGVDFNTDYDNLKKGYCEFNVNPGNWTCGFNGPKPDDDPLTQKFSVWRYNREMIDEAVTLNEDNTTSLEVHHIYQEPLKTCMFLSPSRKLYVLPSDNFKSAGHSFFGGKMYNGDCGIKLSEQNYEEGVWQCIVRKKENDRQLTLDMLV